MTGTQLLLWGHDYVRYRWRTYVAETMAEVNERLKGFVRENMTPETMDNIRRELTRFVVSRQLPTATNFEVHSVGPNQINVTFEIPLDSLDIHLVI